MLQALYSTNLACVGETQAQIIQHLSTGTLVFSPDELCEDLDVCEQSRDAWRVVVGEEPLGERLQQPEGGLLVAARRQQQEAGHVVETLQGDDSTEDILGTSQTCLMF